MKKITVRVMALASTLAALLMAGGAGLSKGY
jgi:ABC-type sugar transport system substrate-binding protein